MNYLNQKHIKIFLFYKLYIAQSRLTLTHFRYHLKTNRVITKFSLKRYAIMKTISLLFFIVLFLLPIILCDVANGTAELHTEIAEPNDVGTENATTETIDTTTKEKRKRFKIIKVNNEHNKDVNKTRLRKVKKRRNNTIPGRERNDVTRSDKQNEAGQEAFVGGCATGYERAYDNSCQLIEYDYVEY